MKIITLDTIGSTNDYCLSNAELLLEHGTVVRAREQTKGKGRFGRNWVSSAGKDLTLSLIYHPNTNNVKIHTATVLTGLAVRRALNSIAHHTFAIKWPNDILYNMKKICGILVERATVSDQDVLVIGIGININTEPKNLYPGATSLYDITGTEMDIDLVFENVIDEVTSLLRDMTLDTRLVAEWNGASPFNGTEVSFTQDNSIQKGILSGINSDGSITIITSDNREIRYTGEIDYAR
ncbi:MAG TPA: biotin--[acetyl-CoA-carboxylase] ligase [Spirochaetota bacterium]